MDLAQARYISALTPDVEGQQWLCDKGAAGNGRRRKATRPRFPHDVERHEESKTTGLLSPLLLHLPFAAHICGFDSLEEASLWCPQI